MLHSRAIDGADLNAYRDAFGKHFFEGAALFGDDTLGTFASDCGDRDVVNCDLQVIIRRYKIAAKNFQPKGILKLVDLSDNRTESVDACCRTFSCKT